MNIGLVIQARTGSTRLPGKVLMDIGSKPVLWHILKRLEKINKNYKRIIITSTSKQDDVIEKFCQKNKTSCFRGKEEDVLDRYCQAAKFFQLNHIVRLCGDSPLIDADNLEFLIKEHLSKNADYSSNMSVLNSGLPIGVGAEVFKFSALQKSWVDGKKDHHREQVNEYILENPEKFNLLIVKALNDKLSKFKDLRLTLDTIEDLKFIRKIIRLLNKRNLEINFNNICLLKEKGYL